MKIWLRKLIDTTSMMKNRRATADLLDRLTRELGFDCYRATIACHTGLGSFMLSNAPEEWLEKYWRDRFDKIDPILTRAREKMEPFVWSFEQERKVARGAKRIFYSSAHEAGIRAGITMPVATPLNNLFIFTLFTGDVTLPLKFQLQPVLTANAMALLHVCIEATGAASSKAPGIELTGRQSMVLKWAAEGKTTKEIALIENMTHHNVNFHMKNVRRILKTVSLPQTTALATKLKLI
jgi:DNA-binding CsgD family transcriptional regulator